MAEPSEEVSSRLVSGIVLPEDPTVEELARDWTLSEADIREVLVCRGPDNCLRFALQLCVHADIFCALTQAVIEVKFNACYVSRGAIA